MVAASGVWEALMAVVTHNRRPTAVARRVGYLIAASSGVVMLYLVNVWPGWQVVPFLTARFPQVLGLLNVSLGVGIVLNLVYLVADPRRWKPAGDLVNAVVGLAVLVRFWRVFPFAFTATSFDWAPVLRGLLGLAIAGCLVGLVALTAMVLRALISTGHR
jgi:hypothetical protein